MFNFMKMDDPFLGEGTFGQLARFGPERCYVMHMLLLELADGGWKWKDEFQQFREANDLVAGDAEKEYLDEAVDVFFQRFQALFDKHMVSKWTSTEIVHYVLGGDPDHAMEFAKWLVHHQNNCVDSSDETTEDREMEVFYFDKRQVTLGEHHRRYRGNNALDVVVDLEESMKFISKNVDWLVVLNDPFVTRNWAHIESLATEPSAVNIWDKSSTAFKKYAPFRLDVISTICIHSSHQQQCENYVQLCGLISMTGVGEVRQSCRAIINSTLHRRFNRWALQHVNEERRKRNEDPVFRLTGGKRMTLFQIFTKEFLTKADRGKQMQPELWKTVRSRLSNGSMKASNTEKLRRIKRFNESLKKEVKTVKAVQPMGIEQTVHTARAVLLNIFARTNDQYLAGSNFTVEMLLDAELRVRGLEKELDKEASLKEKRNVIQQDEYGKIKKTNPTKEVAISMVKEFKPVSEEMKEFLVSGLQTKIMDSRKRKSY
jgi:hypothetical protein